MPRNSAIETYNARLDEAKGIALAASKELRARARTLVKELQAINAAYADLHGRDIPEIDPLRAGAGRHGRNTPQPSDYRDSQPGTKIRRPREKRKGPYADMTITDAVLVYLRKSRKPRSASEIVEELGGNIQSVRMALVVMAKKGRLKRVSHGVYTLG